MPGTDRRLTEGPEATEAVAAEVARQLSPGDIVFLSGEVGTGKTTFVRAACRELGVRGPVTSPSFTLARRYEGERYPISHLDFQRIGGGEEDPALFDSEAGPERVTFVEWSAEAPAGIGWVPACEVSFTHEGGDARQLTVEWHRDR
ncbi:MAG: tRNA (adenosine(37)-N6)-threonylcarbamoyltransferase complex ATPase subunit type 1 TsaE [Acidobacteria bacterium]|nr:tRNA (adenosine(37)-N6)-threonylcarbamoyltransferase complex ATPase subunit type 1 TsaE [Acidobacteriota bacterium]